jgi:N-acetylneuraminate lyase
MNLPHLKGLIAAPFTPFHADGSLNLPAIEAQAAWLVRSRVAGAFICGTTGEGSSLSTAERMQVAERWKAAAEGKLRLLVHVGHTSLEEARALAFHAQKIGADCVGALAPFFFKPAATEDLASFCANVASAAPELPFYYYHIPSFTGVNLPVIDFLKVASGRIPNLAGVKFTFENLMDYQQCLEHENGRFDLVFGRDEMFLAGLAVGAKAAIGSTYNFAAPIYHRLQAAFERGDLAAARQEQMRSIQMIQVLSGHGFLPAAKAVMGMMGIPVGPTRSPNRNLTGDQIARLKADLERIGFFGWL